MKMKNQRATKLTPKEKKDSTVRYISYEHNI